MIDLFLYLVQVAQLVEDIQRLQIMANKLRDTSSSQMALLEEELSSKTRSLQILEEKLATQSDYDEIKRELRCHICPAFIYFLLLLLALYSLRGMYDPLGSYTITQ